MDINKLNINGVEYNLTDKDAQSKIISLQENTYTKTEVDSLIDTVDDKIDNIDLTPYETVEGAKSKYQPKGNYLTEHQSLDNYYTKEEIDTAVDDKFKDYATKEDLYDDTDIKNRVSELEAIDHSQYITEHLDISNLATKAEVKVVSDKADAIEIPSKVSELTNDSKYQTESEVKDAIQKVVGAAPEALDTLEEIAAKLSEDSDAINTINNVLTNTKTELNNKINEMVWKGTQSEYDSLTTKNSNTFYIVQ